VLHAEPRPEVVRGEGGVPRGGHAGGRREGRGVEERRDEGERVATAARAAPALLSPRPRRASQIGWPAELVFVSSSVFSRSRLYVIDPCASLRLLYQRSARGRERTDAAMRGGTGCNGRRVCGARGSVRARVEHTWSGRIAVARRALGAWRPRRCLRTERAERAVYADNGTSTPRCFAAE
jgi:hypothetical protein